MVPRSLACAVLLLAGAAMPSAPAAGADACSDVAAVYDACLAAGQRAYNSTGLGAGDFSYIERCTTEKKQAMATQCHDPAAQLRDYQAAHRQNAALHDKQMLDDTVDAARAAGCRPDKIPGPDETIRNQIVCARSPGPGLECFSADGGVRWTCQVSPQVFATLTGEAAPPDRKLGDPGQAANLPPITRSACLAMAPRSDIIQLPDGRAYCVVQADRPAPTNEWHYLTEDAPKPKRHLPKSPIAVSNGVRD